jgi:hypothetical protein
MSLQDSDLVVSVMIVNHSAMTLPAYTTTGMPVRLSPRFVDGSAERADLRHGMAWNSRVSIGFDVPSGTSRPALISMTPPRQPGTYRVAVSLVQDGVAWFHNLGMPIPISTQTVLVADDGTVHVSSDASH